MAPHSPVPEPEPNARVPKHARPDGRPANQIRSLRFRNGIAPHAAGSTLVEWGHTRVICAVTSEDNVPRWMKEQNIPGGWITAEYSMLPYSTLERKPRDISRGRLDGRSQEIQRLVGRAMRAAVQLEQLGPRTLWVDCDVLQADGGTRTAAINGGYLALALALRRLRAERNLPDHLLTHAVAAVSVGIVGGEPRLDLCYEEDAAAEVDLNLVMTSAGDFIELQGTGEKATFSETALQTMLELARTGIQQIFEAQRLALEEPPG